MKHIILLCDGMADRPFEELGGHTPMELAHKPAMDALARQSEVGLVKTVQDGGLFAIFPEGTRSKTGELGKPKSGAVLVAAKTGGDIIPCCINFEGKLHFRSKVTVKYGKVIKNEELGIHEVTPAELKTASKMMMSKIAELYESGSDVQKG